MIEQQNIPLPTLKRYSVYLSALSSCKTNWISTSVIGDKTGLKPITIRKDLGYLGVKGQPQKGYPKKTLIKGLREVLGGKSCRDIILVGSWGLASIYKEMPQLLVGDFKLRVCFDYVDEEDKSTPIPIYPLDRLEDLIPRLGVSMALLSVEPDKAIIVSEKLFSHGIKGILNMTTVDLPTYDDNRVVDFNPMQGLSELLGLIQS